MVEFYTPALLITDYYDSLIAQLDIYTEKRIKKYNEKGLREKDFERCIIGTRNIFQLGKSPKNPYIKSKHQKFNINRNEFTVRADITQVEDYLNEVRQKAIDEIRKVQDENLEFYNANKEKFKVDKENLTEKKLEELKSNLFAKSHCFLVNIRSIITNKTNKNNKYNTYRNSSLFKLHTLVTDFYLKKSEVEFLWMLFDYNLNIKHLHNFDQRFFLVMQLWKYVSEACYGHANGCEVIQVKQKTLFEINHIEIEWYQTIFNENNFQFDIDLSAIRSMCLSVENVEISDLSGFCNLEYLSIGYIKLCGRPFQNLHKLIKLQIKDCDLSEFDLDSLNSVTTLQILEIKNQLHHIALFDQPLLKIDLRRLINLKWLYININTTDKISFKLINYSYNRELSNYLNRSYLFNKLNKKRFYGMTNLVNLRLENLKLENVDFINTYRLGNLKTLSLAFNHIEVLKKGAFSKLKKLKKLDLRNNRIQDLVPGTFDGLKCLEYLNIDWNYLNLEEINKKTFKGLNRLKHLYYKDMRIKMDNKDDLSEEDLFDFIIKIILGALLIIFSFFCLVSINL